MNYNEKIKKIVAPYYEQFEKLGELYDDNFLSWAFLKKARKRFGKQYFFEIRLLFASERRVLKHNFKVIKFKDKQRFAAVWRSLKANDKAEKQKRKVEESKQKKQSKLEEAEKKKALKTAKKERKQRKKGNKENSAA